MKRLEYRGDGSAPDREALAESERLLRAGELIAAPSDTVYGFLGLATHPEAFERLKAIKGREGRFILLVGSVAMAGEWGVFTQHMADRLERVWPGPVTVVLPARGGFPSTLGSTLALRIPDHGYLTDLLERVQAPLFSTSANFPGKPSPLDARTVVDTVGDHVALVVDGGAASRVRPSTLVDLTRRPAVVLREGSGDAGPLLDPREGPL